ncbi:hypothetical protein [Methylorubrum aminovorans]
MTDAERADFEQAVGECFADAVCPPVSFEMASAHECFEAVNAILPDVSPANLVALRDDQVAALARSFADWFECEAPSELQVRSAVHALRGRLGLDIIGP